MIVCLDGLTSLICERTPSAAAGHAALRSKASQLMNNIMLMITAVPSARSGDAIAVSAREENEA